MFIFEFFVFYYLEVVYDYQRCIFVFLVILVLIKNEELRVFFIMFFKVVDNNIRKQLLLVIYLYFYFKDYFQLNFKINYYCNLKKIIFFFS